MLPEDHFECHQPQGQSEIPASRRTTLNITSTTRAYNDSLPADLIIVNNAIVQSNI